MKSNFTHWTFKKKLHVQHIKLSTSINQSKRVRKYAMNQCKPFLFHYFYMSCHYNTTMIVSATIFIQTCHSQVCHIPFVHGKLAYGAVYQDITSV